MRIKRRIKILKENSTHIRVYMSDKRKLERLSSKNKKSIPELISLLLKNSGRKKR